MPDEQSADVLRELGLLYFELGLEDLGIEGHLLDGPVFVNLQNGRVFVIKGRRPYQCRRARTASRR